MPIARSWSREKRNGAGDGIRTRDINLGKVALYQLSYSRVERNLYSRVNRALLSNSIVTTNSLSHIVKTLDNAAKHTLWTMFSS